MRMQRREEGFTLVEVLVYVAVFAVSAVFLVSILTTVSRVQSRQGSSNEVNGQISFVGNTIQRLVQTSSLIDMPAGVATSTLKLWLGANATDPTFIYATSGVMYLSQGGAVTSLTDGNVVVDNFTVTKYENRGSIAVVDVNLTLRTNTANAQSQISKTLSTSIARISAATFDSTISPNANNSYDLGTAVQQWRDAYFSGNVTVSGNIGIGVAPSALGTVNIKSNGHIGFSSSTAGVILMAPNSSCFLLTITNAGKFATSSTACP